MVGVFGSYTGRGGGSLVHIWGVFGSYMRGGGGVWFIYEIKQKRKHSIEFACDISFIKQLMS